MSQLFGTDGIQIEALDRNLKITLQITEMSMMVHLLNNHGGLLSLSNDGLSLKLHNQRGGNLLIYQKQITELEAKWLYDRFRGNVFEFIPGQHKASGIKFLEIE